MERDPFLSKLIREDGVVNPPEGFTRRVMERVTTEPGERSYKPLIGRGGRIVIILFVVALVVISIIYSGTGEGTPRFSMDLPELIGRLPEISLNLDRLPKLELSSGLASALVALFILVLSDAGLSRKKII
jgi:hypothetical protein